MNLEPNLPTVRRRASYEARPIYCIARWCALGGLVKYWADALWANHHRHLDRHSRTPCFPRLSYHSEYVSPCSYRAQDTVGLTDSSFVRLRSADTQYKDFARTNTDPPHNPSALAELSRHSCTIASQALASPPLAPTLRATIGLRCRPSDPSGIRERLKHAAVFTLNTGCQWYRPSASKVARTARAKDGSRI